MGVAGLFSKEFYQLIRRHVSPGGVFVQWIHPTSMPLLASVMKALGQNFRDYSIFNAGYFMIIVAGNDVSYDRVSDSTLFVPGVSRFLHENGIDNRGDLRAHYLGSRRSLHPLFESYQLPANSDYHPLLDLLAFKAMVLGQGDSYTKLSSLRHYWLPLVDILEDRRRSGRSPSTNEEAAVRARMLFDYLTTKTPLPQSAFRVQNALQILVEPPGRDPSASPEGIAVGAQAWMSALEWLWTATASYLTNEDVETLLRTIRSHADLGVLPPSAGQLWSLLSAINQGDFRTVREIAGASLSRTDKPGIAEPWQLSAAMLAALQLGDIASIDDLLSRYPVNETSDMGLRLLFARARQRAPSP